MGRKKKANPMVNSLNHGKSPQVSSAVVVPHDSQGKGNNMEPSSSSTVPLANTTSWEDPEPMVIADPLMVHPSASLVPVRLVEVIQQLNAALMSSIQKDVSEIAGNPNSSLSRIVNRKLNVGNEGSEQPGNNESWAISGVAWLMSGDFNVVLHSNDRVNGNAVSNAETVDFDHFLTSTGLAELQSVGHYFSWTSKGLGNSRIMSRIDRALENACWMHEMENIKS
uniref:Uncharacterized protein n=1 Tax=Chenopodium quinoa TaxID=63459 RepID=A0A803MJW7_CHEQI